MRDNFSKKKTNINVPLPSHVYRALIQYESLRGFSTHRSFVEDAIKGNDYVFIDVLMINGQDPACFSAVIQIGEGLYKYQDKKFQLIGERGIGEVFEL